MNIMPQWGWGGGWERYGGLVNGKGNNIKNFLKNNGPTLALPVASVGSRQALLLSLQDTARL